MCSLVGLDEAGAVVVRRRLRRDGVVDFVGRLPGCIVAMEACCGAHHLGRVLGGAGHTIRLMSPEYVRPYVKANKNDDRDAEAIAEAATRPTMRFVPVKSEMQSDIQALHRARSRLVAKRTALINHLRALSLERGVVVARPTLRVRGLLGRAEPILITGERAVADYKEAFGGIDVAKLRNAIAIADSGREGEVRFFGEVDASDESMCRTIQRIATRFDHVHFCCEAGPTGYGLYRLIRSLGSGPINFD